VRINLRGAAHGHRRVRLLFLVVVVAVLGMGQAAVGLTTAEPSSASGTTSKTRTCTPPPGVTCVLGVPYLDDGSSKHTLDAYYPTDLTDRASVVILHGGFWMQGGSRVFAPEAQYLAQNGFAVFAINFARSRPAKPSWPQVRADVEAATAWVMTHADQYHGDDARVGVMGGSSGAHLAALLDTAGPEDGVAPLTTVAWSGGMDLALTYQKGNRAAKHAIVQLLGCTPDVCPQTYADASPVTHVTSDDGSMLFFNSSDEHIPVAVAHEMNRALATAGVPHQLVVFKNSHEHSRQYECEPATVDGATLAVIDDTVRWFGSHLGQPTTPTGTYCSAGPVPSR
jgi:acetyl esterase/lipase